MNPDSPNSPGQRATDLVADLFAADGWKVQREPKAGQYRADLLVKKRRDAYVVEIKTLSEGRPDRIIPLLSQAILQARAFVHMGKGRVLAVVCVGEATASLLKQVGEFRERYAPDVAIGVVSESGNRFFVGAGLDGLNAEHSVVRRTMAKSPGRSLHLFSDLNQWMLKVLLAPEIPPHLLAAPRAGYRNVSELASAADVSVMSAFRFATQLREEGFLDESSTRLKLVRRVALFDRWLSTALRPSPEMRMNFLIPGATRARLRKAVSGRRACLGFFAAAEALHLGHVTGVAPYVYVPKLPHDERGVWKELIPVAKGEPFDLMLKQPRAPQSVFRGAVDQDGVKVCDVLQVWLDVSAHPSRGPEQAELIRRKVLDDVIGAAG